MATAGRGLTELRAVRASRLRSLAVLLGVLVLSTAASLTMGAATIPAATVLAVPVSLIAPQWAAAIAPDGWSDTHQRILLNIRLPRVLLACLVGAALAGAGAAFQGMFKNPMADPHVLGVSSGAALGAVLAIFYNVQMAWMGFTAIPMAAFAGGLLAVFAVYRLARINGRVPVVSLLLAGIAMAALLGSFVSLLVYLAGEKMPPIIFWLLGSLAGAEWSDVRAMLAYMLPMMAILTVFARDLNALLLGDESAHHLGIDVERVKRVLLISGTLLTAAAVSVSGIIGFIGLIIPHAVRLIIGPDHRLLVPTAAMSGAILLLLCDTLARTLIAPTEIPVGILTAMAGAPFFMYLLRRRADQMGGV